MNDFLFFGCWEEGICGHYLANKFGERQLLEDNRLPLDGTFQPIKEVVGTWRRIAIHGRNHRILTILAGWDQTVDKRPGSNAAFVSDGIQTVDEMLARAEKIFPKQHARLFKGNQKFELVSE